MKRRIFLKSIFAALALSMASFGAEKPPKIEEPEWVKAAWQELTRNFMIHDSGDGEGFILTFHE